MGNFQSSETSSSDNNNKNKSSVSTKPSQKQKQQKQQQQPIPKHLLWGCSTVEEHYNAIQQFCDLADTMSSSSSSSLSEVQQQQQPNSIPVAQQLQQLGFEFRMVHAHPCTCCCSSNTTNNNNKEGDNSDEEEEALHHHHIVQTTDVDVESLSSGSSSDDDRENNKERNNDPISSALENGCLNIIETENVVGVGGGFSRAISDIDDYDVNDILDMDEDNDNDNNAITTSAQETSETWSERVVQEDNSSNNNNGEKEGENEPIGQHFMVPIGTRLSDIIIDDDDNHKNKRISIAKKDEEYNNMFAFSTSSSSSPPSSSSKHETIPTLSRIESSASLFSLATHHSLSSAESSGFAYHHQRPQSLPSMTTTANDKSLTNMVEIHGKQHRIVGPDTTTTTATTTMNNNHNTLLNNGNNNKNNHHSNEKDDVSNDNSSLYCCALRLFHIPSNTMITEKIHQSFIAHGKMYDEMARLCMEYAQDVMIQQGQLEWITIPVISNNTNENNNNNQEYIRALVSRNRYYDDEYDTTTTTTTENDSQKLLKTKKLKKTLVIITGTGKVGAGIFSRRLCMTMGIEPATALPFVQEAMNRNMAIVMLDPNKISFSTNCKSLNAMQIVETSLNHFFFHEYNNENENDSESLLLKQYDQQGEENDNQHQQLQYDEEKKEELPIQVSQQQQRSTHNHDDNGISTNNDHRHELYILAHSMAGSQIVRFLLNRANENPHLVSSSSSQYQNGTTTSPTPTIDTFLNPIKAVAFTDSNHNINWIKKYPKLHDFFTGSSSLYIKSHKVHEDAKALGEEHHDCHYWRHRFGTIKTLWAGTNEHALTNHTARFHIWDHFASSSSLSSSSSTLF